MYTATVSAKGWVVIPKPLREKHGLQQGAMVRVIECGRLLALVPLPDDPVEALYGMLHTGRSLTAELLAERVKERAREEGQGD
jgi:AbrB family looped-hinge helix DNA binding protein